MFKKSLILLVMILMILPLVSSASPITVITSDEGFIVEPTIKDYIRTGEDHEFELHIFNKSNGMPITEGISCYMHLYHEIGNHQFEGFDSTVNHDFDFAFNLNGTNFTSRGVYQAKFQCNNSLLGGGTEIQFYVNDYGEELTESIASSHNWSMAFLMILFLGALIGAFKIEHYVGKFASYWVAHLLFVVGTFSVWQFAQGYALSYVAVAGIFKVLFYVSIIAVFPMVILSIAYIVWMHTMTEEIRGMMDKGMTSEEAWSRSNKKGWFGL